MQKRFEDELDPEVKLKVKKNLVYVSIFSIIMLFAGFTSAYIVSMGDTFWVKYPLPSAFWVSTILIILSSISYILAINFSVKNIAKKARVWMVITFFCGLGFIYFQFRGYDQLLEKGAHLTGSILVTEGRYGDYFEIKYLDKFIEVNANEYLIDGKPMSPKQYQELKTFIKQFENTANASGYVIRPYSPKFTLYYQHEPLSVQQNKLVTPSGKELKYVDMVRLKYLAWNIRDDRGDFFYKGKLGEDFDIFYKGKKLNYKNRELYVGQQKLTPPLQLKINQANDTASSYLFIITFLHLLHIAVAIIYLFRMVLITFKPSLSADNQLSMRLGGIFWHFLGILWIYLLVFLLFIH